MRLELLTLANYPFLPQASLYVKELGISARELVYEKAYDLVRIRGRERVLGALRGGGPGQDLRSLDHAKESHLIRELLSYPFSRMILSAIGDAYLIRRFAMVEAKTAHRRLERESPAFTVQIGKDLGLDVDRMTGDKLRVHFLDYIHVSSVLRGIEWKLVNRRVKDGWVVLNHKDYLRILQEFIRLRIEEGLPLDLPAELRGGIERYLSEIREELSKKTAKFADGIPVVNPEKFPPCIRSMIQDIAAGINLPHSARFTLTSFLLKIGLSVEDIIKIYRSSPDFDESKTRYQVEHIASRGYTPPSCSTIRTYGNCTGSCPNPGHPLTIYLRAIEGGEDHEGTR
ncbi:MAG TPA: DNA primase regulatory subunit PriL [Candidatus Syntrophoarchaeum butanivorans]|uniref:DNA primase large subunit PriL n=1 Tax=Candidatus Syntropharchaeum butanivorans TaxID=1839936 RepID=A0A7C1B6W6_9EURY|nr:DNA primase regulatory subunit PriL [Candidatus Syntrophoarchaeum butanivorans]